MSLEEKLKRIIRDVQDFPKEGIVFKDLTTVLLDVELTREVIKAMAANVAQKPDAIAGIESRGFWFGTLLAQELEVPFIPFRKVGKLPGETDQVHYDLEYGKASIEVHKGHIQKDWKVLVHDDLLATGGTALAAAELIEKQGALVHSFSFLVSLSFLEADKHFKKAYPNTPLQSLITF